MLFGLEEAREFISARLLGAYAGPNRRSGRGCTVLIHKIYLR